MTDIKEPLAVGGFYSKDSVGLTSEIESFFANTVAKQISGEIIGMVAPNADYHLSGQVASECYQQIMGRDIEVAVIISPSHREVFEGASVYPGNYKTPLGTIETAQNIVDALIEKNDTLFASDYGHRYEHGIEVQIPLLQSSVKNCKIVPIVMGNQTLKSSQKLGNALAEVLSGKKVVIIASTNLSHYNTYREAIKLDNVVSKNIRNLDENQLAEDLREKRGSMSGGGPTIATIIASKKLGANKTEILSYVNSGDMDLNREEVIGFLSALFYKK